MAQIRPFSLRVGALLVFLAIAATYLRARSAPLRLVKTVSLPDVQGRIDHFGIDLRGNRLFMSALGNNTLEVFNLKTGARIHTIRGLDHPQGVVYAPHAKRIFVDNAGDGTCRIFDGSSYRLLRVIHFSSDADDARYDARTRRVYVGYGDGGLAVIDPAHATLAETIKLPVHPEAFEVGPSGTDVYVNLPSAGNIIGVVSLSTRRIIATWKIAGAAGNFPMALDAAQHRLFVVCRRPAELVVLSTRSGRAIARVPCTGDADDLWLDAARKRLYISGGQGYISVIAQLDANHYRTVSQIRSVPGARTSCFVPELSRLYLGVRRYGDHPAELRIYQAEK